MLCMGTPFVTLCVTHETSTQSIGLIASFRRNYRGSLTQNFSRKVASSRLYTVGLRASTRWPDGSAADIPEFWNRCESF
ncbi:hypothetical protein ALR00_03476 [Pseudomonas savastanoi pv. retacarpa]|nr:hypothetical protein ALR00_03476 [Pseudomonas savastanoi pv. retacarpa]